MIAPTLEAAPGTTQSIPEDDAIQFEDALLADPIYGPDESQASRKQLGKHHHPKILPSPKEMTEE